jgi:hypothetical protein
MTHVPAERTEMTQAVSVGMLDSNSYALAKKISVDLAASNLVPERFRGNAPNCMIALNMSARIGADPLMVMQNLYVVHGTPGWSAQFLIATFNNNPKFSALRYEFKGKEGTDGWACRAWAVEKESGEELKGSWVSIGLAKKEGWYNKSGSKWQTMPQQMLMYRAAAWFIRAYAPEIAMGLHTADEIRETVDLHRSEDGTYTATEMAAPTAADLNETIVDTSAEEQPSTPDPQPEPAAEEQDAEQQLGEEYLGLSAADRKKALFEWLRGYDITEQDMTKLVGKSYGQWARKERQALADAYMQLASGADPAAVFA